MRKIYLDTNKWIDLARAHCGRKNGERFAGVLAYLRQSVEKGELVLPVSLTHCLELNRYGQSEKRRDVWEFVVSLSRCWAIASSPRVLDQLISNCVYETFKRDHATGEPRVFGHSAVFGLWPEPPSSGDGAAWRDFLETPQGWMHFWLDMPEDTRRELHVGLSRLNQAACDRVNSALQNAPKNELDLERRSYMVTLFLDFQDRYLAAASKIGKGNEDFLQLAYEDAVGLIAHVPPLDVETALVVQHRRQSDRPMAPNDVADVAQLSMAIPYCDVVVTERYWTDKARRENLDVRYATRLLSDLNDLMI